MAPTVTSERLVSAMRSAHITKGRLQRDAPIDRKHLNKLLEGELNLGRKKAEDVARVLGVSPAWLMGLDDAGGVPTNGPGAIAREQTTRFGSWMLELPDDVRAFVYFMGEVLKRREGLGRFAEIAAQALRSMDSGTGAPPGTTRKRRAAATRTGPGKAPAR